MSYSKFRGVGVALITPFRNDGSIDFNALKTLIEEQISNGTNYIVALGTTSESATLTNDEKHAVVDYIIEVVNDRIPLVVGCGGNNTAEIIKQAKSFEKPGVDALLSVAPYYNKPSQLGIYEHFKAIANASSLPIILYNVPGRTASNIAAETTIKLGKEFKNIIGIKEACGDFSQMMNIIKNKPNNFIVLSGDDATTLPLISVGFDGVISVVANAYPKHFSDLIDYALKGNFADARSIQYQLIDILESMFEEGNPAGVKAYLTHLGLIENNLRLPLVPVSSNLNAKIKKLANALA